MTDQRRNPDWPPDVHSISLGGLSRLGIDNKNTLYWDGKRVQIARRLELSRAQGIFAIIGVLAGVLIAAVEFLRFLGFGH
jgi:hypothetical protein